MRTILAWHKKLSLSQNYLRMKSNLWIIVGLSPMLLCWLLPFSIYGSQQQSYYFKSLGVEDGLSQNMVYSIIQDKQGFMWFATMDGLNRYDGTSFKIYKKNPFTNNSLKSDAIFSLVEDLNGILWIGTDEGVMLYDPMQECFSEFPLYIEGKSAEGIVRDIILDKKGNIWLTISDKGVFCITPYKETKYYSLSHYFKKGQGSIRDLCFDADGNLWIATYRKGIFKLNPTTEEFTQFMIDDALANLSNNDVDALYLLNSETLLVGTINKGVLKLNLREHQLAPFITKGKDNKHLFVRTLYVDTENNIWIGTESGVIIYSQTTGETTYLQHLFNDPYSISDNAIHAIYQDREGGIWLGTYFGGVNYFAKSYARFEKYYPITGENTVSGKSISEFCEDSSGKIWIATEDVGLNCFDPVKKTFTNGFIPANNLHALMYDGEKLWIGSFSKGLFVMDLKSRKVKNYLSSPSDKSLNNDNIYSIYKDYQGTIWIGTMTGLHRYLPHTDSFEAVSEKEISSQVNDIIEDFDGILWFATLGQGVFSYNRKKNLWEHHRTLLTGDSRGKMVVCILEDKHHGLWMGTEGAGMVYYDRHSDKFTKHYDTHNGLPNNIIYRLCEDVGGGIWGSTSKGLFRFDPQTEVVKCYSHKDGLLGDQFNYKSGFTSKNGKIYFGGVKGFISFDADKLASSTVPPSIIFNSFQLFNSEVSIGSKNSPLQQSIIYTKQITLFYGQSIFSIGFATPNYSSPQGNQYFYKLTGWDKDWINVGQSHQVTYSNLPPGRYIFTVKVMNDDGLWGEVSNSLGIRILPPFYKTFWAYLCYVIMILLLGYYLFRSYIKSLQKRNEKAMELLEREKEKELYDAKINFFTNVTHEIRTPLSLIKSPLEEIMKEVKKSDVHFENLSIIQRNTNRLLKLVNELLDFRKTEAKGLKLNLTRTDIALQIRETVKRFVPAANTKNILFRQLFPEKGFMADVDVEIFTKILSNLFNNALKHAYSFIQIELEHKGDTFKLTVSNDGDRIPPKESTRVFKPFVKLNENSMGTGIGLPFAKTLVESHKGEIFIDTNYIDVTFVIILPIRQKASISLNQECEEKSELESTEKHPDFALPISDSRKTILSVEDNEEFQDFMTNQLKKDYQIIKAKNGQQALEILNEQFVDLIVSDIMMPLMDGMSLCQRLKENVRYSHIPIILLTAKTGLQSQIDGLKMGADDYIVKPYSIDFLKARIENLLTNRQKIRESYKHSPESTVEVIAHTKTDKHFLNKLVESIHARLEEVDLDVDALAEMMNMSRATLYRKVKSISELTPNDFIRLIRLKKAAELLRNKEYRVNEIAFIVGFNSSSYFSKCFFKQFGVLPKDFEKKG